MNIESTYVDDRKQQRDNRRKNNKPSRDDHDDALYDNQSYNSKKDKRKKGNR